MVLLKKFTFSPLDIEIPERVLAARMGFKGVGKIPEEFKKAYERMHDLICDITEPTAMVQEYDASHENEIVKIYNLEINGKLASSQLGKSVKISAMLVSLGEKLDDKISQLHEEGKEVESFFLDSIGSELVEFTARTVDGLLRDNTDLKGSARISPGYVDLPLSLNAWFARNMGKEVGVICDEESFTFVPRKTISAFIGWSN